jgi:hypothetical protein
MAQKKDAKAVARKRATKQLKKRTKDNERRKTFARTGVALSENAVQHQMISQFGSPQNFIKNVFALGEMMKTEADLKTLRYAPEQVYAHLDLTADRAALADVYEKKDDLPAYAEEFIDFWHEKRKAILKDTVTDEFVERCDKLFKKLLLVKKGFKKEYRAVLAGRLLVQSHQVAATPADAPLEDNNLWELILLATIKENLRELPPLPAEPPAPAAESAPAAEPAPELPGEPV